MLSKNKKIINFFHLKIIVFTPVKNCCILYGRVFVMHYIENNTDELFTRIQPSLSDRFFISWKHNLLFCILYTLFSIFQKKETEKGKKKQERMKKKTISNAY